MESTKRSWMTQAGLHYRGGKIRRPLEQLLQELQDVHQQYMAEFQACPEGTLLSQRNRGRTQYMQVVYQNGRRHRLGITRDHTTLRGLARKEFLRTGLDLLKRDITLISQTIQQSEDLDSEKILSELKTRFSGLPEEYFFDPTHFSGSRLIDDSLKKRLQSHELWASQDYEKSSYRSKGRRIRTSRGLMVRTKSEALICELLYEYGIPFRYEQVLHIDELTFVPDFTFEGATGALLYWEHAGMMTDARYSFRHHMKMMQYEAAGIYPWQNLIVTYDIHNDIDLERIDAIIRYFLLPLL